MLEEIWDGLLDGVSYIFSFEWAGDAWEWITSIFDDAGEFSIGGLVFAIATIAFIYYLKDYMLYPFLLHMGKFEFYLWGGATYGVCGIMGYFIGKKIFED